MFQDVIVPPNQAEPPAQNPIQAPPPQYPDQPEPPKKKRREGLWGLLSVISIFVIAGLFAVGITKFVFQSYQVDGPSMETTLQNNDRLIVMKTAKTWATIRGETYTPERYDIIVFDSINSFGADTQRQLIKRVIGLPGERVIINDGSVKVLNEEFPEGMNPDQNQEYSESFESTSGNIDLTLDENEIFALGDNRSNSLDSRNFGAIPVDNVVGYLYLRIYPLDKIQSFN